MKPMWNYSGSKRPPFAESPGAGQESVWDYPRPPQLLADVRLIEVLSGCNLIARSDKTYRVCETASPPTFYIPPADIDLNLLKEAAGSSYCEWKGAARYWVLKARPAPVPVGWSYPKPRAAFSKLKDFVSFYPGRVDCYVNGDLVRPQPGGFYGGWITDDVVGPFKGEPGTGHW